MDSRIRPYKKEHYHEIAQWFMKRRMNVPPQYGLSDEGFIIPGLAAGFLYVTNSSVGFIDCLITNPDSNKADRSEAIDNVVRRLIWAASSAGVKILCCSSKIPSIQKKARIFGFMDTGTHMGFSREL